MDCMGCVVPKYGDPEATERFCNKCQHQQLRKSYCVALREEGQPLQPFIALDDADQATTYAGRLQRQGVPHIILSWDPCGDHFADFGAARCG